jgi:hypothetical protein
MHMFCVNQCLQYEIDSHNEHQVPNDHRMMILETLVMYAAVTYHQMPVTTRHWL